MSWSLADEAKVKLVPIVPPTPAPTSLRADTSLRSGDSAFLPVEIEGGELDGEDTAGVFSLVTWSFIRLPSIVDCAISTVLGAASCPQCGRFCETEAEKSPCRIVVVRSTTTDSVLRAMEGVALPDGAEAHVALFVTILGDKGRVINRLDRAKRRPSPFGR